MVFCNLLKVGRWKGGARYLEIREGCQPDGDFLDPPWAKIILRSARVKESVESATVKAAWLDECGMNMFKLNIWEAIQRRLSLHQGRVLGTTTIYNRGWLKSQVYDLWKAGDETFDVIQFSSHINPSFPKEEYDRVARVMPRWKLRMFYQGLWDLPPGIIFDVFNPDTDAIAPRHIPREWPVLVGIDPIGERTTALGFAFDEERGQLHLYDEYYQAYGRTTAEHVAAVLKKFPKHRVVAYVGGGPSERQARTDWAAAGINLQPPPVYSVESGIDALYGMFKTKQLLIHRNCIHTIDELGMYSRPLDENDEPTAGIENKGHDDHCVVAGTMVTTDVGDVPIELVSRAHKVLTRKGYKRVLRSWKTKPSAETFVVKLSDGTELEGTAAHPVYVTSRGWVDLHELRYGDILVTKKEASRWSEKKLSMPVRCGGGIPRQNIGRAGSILRGWRGRGKLEGFFIFTDLFGRRARGLFQRVLLSTIKMGKQRTTTLGTWNYCLARNMQLVIGQRNRVSGTKGGLVRYGIWPRSGMVLLRVGPGTVSMEGRCGKVVSPQLGFVIDVAQRLNRVLRRRMFVFARTSVNLLIAALHRSMRKIGNVPFVGQSLQLTSTQRPSAAPVHVLSVTGVEQRKSVYNLMVEGEPEFFASGVLVHNCVDASRYAAVWATKPGTVAERVSYQPIQIGRY